MTKKIVIILCIIAVGIGYYAMSQQGTWTQEGTAAQSATLAELASTQSQATPILKAQGLIVVSSRP